MSGTFLKPGFTPDDGGTRCAFSGSHLDRLSELRADDCVEVALADPAARIWASLPGRMVLDMSGTPRGHFARGELDALAPKWADCVLLGFEDGAPRLAVPLAIKPDAEGAFDLPENLKAIDLRSLATQSLLTPQHLGEVAYASGLLSWHGTNRFCARCGQPSRLAQGGAKRICTSCEKEHFPRTDPVVIMLAVDGERCLLGRSHHFPPGMYSALAGFVEPGETLETAVRRETFEESGVHIGKVHYHASQPWPFPHSLMIGCYGEALDTDVDIDEHELDDCRWFSRTELKAIFAGNGPQNDDGTPEFFVPPPIAIASLLIRDWVEKGV